MKKYKGRKDLGGIAKMMGKLKNPSEETIANLKDISAVLADEEKTQSESSIPGGTVVTPVEPSEMEIPENASKKKEEKDKEKEEKKLQEERLKQGNALKKSKKADDLSINTSNTKDEDIDMGGSMVAKIFRKRKARKAEGADAKRKAEEKAKAEAEAKKKKYRMTVFDEEPPGYSGENDPPVPEPTL